MLLLLLNTALAEDLVPTEGSASLVRASDGGGVYYPLSDGGQLDFEVVGPAKLEIEARMRLPTADSPEGEVSLSAMGDGMHILTVKIDGGIDLTGMVMDSHGGVPTLLDHAQITVPEGEHTFTLSYTEGAYPALVKVSVEGEMRKPEVVVEPEPQPEPEPEVVEPEPEPVIVEPEPQPEPQPEPELAVVEPDGEPEAEPEAEPAVIAPYEPELGPPQPAEPPSLALGVRLGLGNTRAGNRTSLYAGLELRKPLTDSLGLSLRLGRYGVGLDTEVPIQPAIGAYDGVTQHVAWKTRVREADLAVRTVQPLVGRLDLSAQAGFALYHSTRLEDEERAGGLSVGLAGAVGVELPLMNGVLSPELALNTGRRSFGNPAAGGAEARESLGGAHLNVAYLVSF